MVFKRFHSAYNFFNVVFKNNVKTLLKFFLIGTPGALAALCEGLSFTFLLVSLYVFNGRGLEVLAEKPLLNKLTHFSFLSDLSNNHLFLIFLFAAIISQLLKSGIVYISNYRSSILNAKILANVQRRVYKQILSFDFQTVSQYKSGDLANYAALPSASIPIITNSLHKIFVQGFILLTLLALLFKISVFSTFVFIGLFVISALIYRKITQVISRYSSSSSKQAAEFTKNVVQSINGIKLIHIFGLQTVVLNKSSAIIRKIERYTYRSGKYEHLLIASSEVFSMIMMAVTLLVSSFFLILSSSHSLPLLLTYLAIVYRFTTTTREVIIQVGNIANRFGYVERLNTLFINDGKGYEEREGLPSPPLKKELTFRNISFHYPTKTSNALEDFSFSLMKGKMVALVGLSGSGKSTLVNLLTRLYSPTKGKILVDGKDLQAFDVMGWRSKLGVVSQNAVIFNDTARENIAFGMERSDKEIWEACHLAGCATFIENLPEGLDTPLGEHGYRISGGESQRITIARALVRKPEILIFDEATSNLDTHNERLIHQTLDKIRHQTTLIVIAHRLSTIIDADQILVLEKGSLLEEGTHEGLLEKNGKYAYLWNLQSKKSLDPTQEALNVSL